MSAKLQARGLASEYAATLLDFPGILHTIEHLIETNLPKAIALIEEILPFLPADSKLAIALKAILALVKVA